MTIFEKKNFLGEIAIKSGLNGLKSKEDVLLGILVFFGTNVQKTLFRIPKDPLFVKVGVVVVVVVNHENQWEENGKQ